MANRLARESSPYLLQHKDNPVDWYPWGEEAFRKAQEEDKPILLSVGYSACHWCHVMERESFEDDAIAAFMNEHFVNVKVDREERPDVDSLYMSAVQAMIGSGGWPMTVFLTPEGAPFYAGTYFPREPRGGMPGFLQVLASVADAYENRREEVLRSAGSVRDYLRRAVEAAMPEGTPGVSLLERAGEELTSEIDRRLGGFGGAPKFPQPMNLEFLLRYHLRTGSEEALSGVELTLEAMARGGIYDQLGGGFHRYSVDARWLVPHFEKMLYDNALLSRLYLDACRLTGRDLYRRVAGETLDYVAREMTSPEGGFYSSEDADSEGEEGRFYVWSVREIRDVLTPGEAHLAEVYWGVSERGNFEGKNILHVPRPPEEVARELGISPEELGRRVEEIRTKLLAARGRRVRPGRDEKILVAWNGLMLRSFALASVVSGREDYREIARRNAAFLLEKARPDGRLRRSYKDGRAGEVPGYLEDYACLVEGLLALHEATLEPRWLVEARDLAEEMVALFWEEDEGRFYDAHAGHQELIARPRDLYDNATPSGNSVATGVLLELSLLLDRPDYREKAERVLSSMSGTMEKVPGAFGWLLSVLDFYLADPCEVAVIGEPGAEDTGELLRAMGSRYLPHRVVAGRSPRDERAAALSPLLEGREARGGRATAYVCRNYACQSPTTDPDELLRQLGG